VAGRVRVGVVEPAETQCPWVVKARREMRWEVQRLQKERFYQDTAAVILVVAIGRRWNTD
jgi:hypothetical protein